MRTDTRFVLGFSLAALGVAGLMYWYRCAPPAAESAHGVALGAPSAHALNQAPWPETFAYRLRPGQAYRYGLSRNTSISREGAPYLRINGQGTLVVDVLRNASGHADALVSIELAGSAGKPGAGGAKPTPIAVSGSARVRIGPSGRVEMLAFKPEDSANERARLFTTLLSAWLYALPDAGTPRGRAVEGSDDSGVFLAQYSARGQDASPFEVVMQKQSYSRAALLMRIMRSDHHLRWDLNEGHLLSARSEDRFGKGPVELEIETHETSEITFLGMSASALDEAQLAAYTAHTTLYVEPVAKVGGRSHPAGGAPTKPWAELQQELRNLPSDPESEKPMEVFTSLAASLEQDPSMLGSVLEEARGHASGSDAFSMLVGAVGQLGTPEAQQGLIDLYETRDTAGKDLVLKTQILLKEPATPQTRGMLLDTYDREGDPGLKSVAGLALGNALHDAGDDPTVETAQARITRMWSEATTPNEKEYVLNVIGNSGDPYFMPILSSEIQDATSMVRARALSALRFMDTEESSLLLMHAVAMKDTPNLQLAALDALLYHDWHPEFYEPLAACFLEPLTPDVRIGCAKVVLRQPSAQHQMQAVLARARDSGDTDEHVAEFIGSQLL